MKTTSQRVSSSDQPSLKHNDSCHFVLFLLMMLFSVNSNLATNSLWVQLPTLLPQVPEGVALRTYCIIILELGNVAAVALLLLRKCAAQRTINDVPFVYTSFALNLLSLTLAALFWQTATHVSFGYFSFILLFCAFLSSLVSCTSPLTYLPFGARIRAVYVPAVLLGCVLSETIPHITAFLQGIGHYPACSQIEALANITQAARYSRPGPLRVRTTTAPPLPPQTKFEEFYFFLSMAIGVFFSGLALFVIRHSCRLARDETDACNQADAAASTEIEVLCHHDVSADESDDALQNSSSHSHATAALDVDGSIRMMRTASRSPSTRDAREHSAHDDVFVASGSREFKTSKRNASPWQQQHQHVSHAPRDAFRQQPGRRRTRFSSTSSSFRMSTTSSVTSQRPNTFPLLMLLTFWIKCVLSGPLSSVKAHACYPAGNPRFMFGVLASNVAMMAACLVSLRLHRQSRVTIVFALTSLATITLAYFVALIGFSYVNSDYSNSLVFKTAGELLAVSQLRLLELADLQDGGRTPGGKSTANT